MLIPTWFIIGFLSVLIGVIGSFFDKYLLKKYFGSDESSSGAGALIIFSAFFLYILIPFLLVFGEGKIDFSLGVGTVGFISGVLSCLWILLYLHALSRVDVSQAIPVFQTIPIFGLVLGYLFFGEMLTFEQFTAAVVILLGAHILLKNKEGISGGSGRTTLLLMLSSSFFVALSQVVFKVAAVDVNFWTALFWNWVGFVFLGFVLYVSVKQYRLQFRGLLRKRISALSKIYSVSAVNEIFDITSDALLLGAVILGPVALVQSVNAYEPFLTLAFGFILVKSIPKYFESDFSKATLHQKIIGITIITLGSLILYTSF
tara:strand:+ start:2787 stop:3734 length:948 start_codon:yes stop_codon:yes gene_type:complete